MVGERKRVREVVERVCNDEIGEDDNRCGAVVQGR